MIFDVLFSLAPFIFIFFQWLEKKKWMLRLLMSNHSDVCLFKIQLKV